MAVHYVDNQKFLEEMIEYQEAREMAKTNDEELPPCPEYIGECFLKIANRLSYRPNFINYAFREDMISDGIENCVQYMNNFNPEKSKKLIKAIFSASNLANFLINDLLDY